MCYELYRIVGKDEPLYIFECEAEELEEILKYKKRQKKIKKWVIIDNAPSSGRLNYHQLGYKNYTHLNEVSRRIYYCKCMKYIISSENGEDLNLLVENAKERAKNETIDLLKRTVFLGTTDYSAILFYLGD